LTRQRRGKAAENQAEARQGRGRLLEAEAECSETKTRQSENHVNDDTRNIDNKLNSLRNTHTPRKR